MRGNSFFHHNSEDYKFIKGWDANFCNVLKGYFTKNCETIIAGGQNKATVCPKNKFWNGVQRETSGIGLETLRYLCCEIEYHEPLRGDHPLPDSFKDKDGKFSFHQAKGNRWLRMNDGSIDIKSPDHGPSERFSVQAVDINKGTYRIISHQS